MPPISYSRHRFPPMVIQHAVWSYLRFTLSFRDVEPDELAYHLTHAADGTTLAELVRVAGTRWAFVELFAPVGPR